MTKDSKKIAFLVLIILGLGIVLYKGAQRSSVVKTEAFQDKSDTEAISAAAIPQNAETNQVKGAVPATIPVVSEQAEVLKDTPLNEQELKSVSQLTALLGKVAVAKSTSVQGMINNIKSLGLIPKKNIDQNPYTGRITILRTENALQGTRYLHVQMPGINPKDEFVQTMSFQVRPGKDSFDKTMLLMKKALPEGSKVQQQSSDFIQWSLPGGKEARVEVLNTMDDLHASKYDAVSKDDIGTVKVTVEIAIHEIDGEHSDL